MNTLKLYFYLKNIPQMNHDHDLARRFTLFPILDNQMYRQMKSQEAVLWTSNELDFSADKHQYDKLSPPLKRLIDYVNCFFSATDGLIVNNIAHRFIVEAKTLEEQAFFITQMYIELVHSETYSLIINTLVTDPDKRTMLFDAANNLLCVRNKNLWMEQHMESAKSKAERLLGFCCAEGIFFISSFLFIFYFRSKGILPNIIFANEIISRDESIHRDTGIMLYLRERRLSDAEAHQIVKEAVDLECQFVEEVLPEDIEDLNKEDVKKYVRYLGDHLLTACQHPKLWDIPVGNLPTWIRDISLQQKGNFYEVRTGNYIKGNLEQAIDWQNRIRGRKEEINLACSDPSEINF